MSKPCVFISYGQYTQRQHRQELVERSGHAQANIQRPLVQRHKQLRATLIEKHSRLAAERIMRLIDTRKKLTIEQIAEAIAAEFLGSPV